MEYWNGLLKGSPRDKGMSAVQFSRIPRPNVPFGTVGHSSNLPLFIFP